MHSSEDNLPAVSPRRDVDPLETAEGRLAMARRQHTIWDLGFDLLVSHGVNFKNLPAFRDTKLLEQADRLSFKRGMELVFEYMDRLEAAILAAPRRKGLALVPA